MARPYGSGRTSLRDRLLSQYEVTESGCWEYTGSRNEKGYGRISLGGREGADIGAHRASWLVHNGEIPDDLNVLHHCDNPPCINPGDLFLGTPGDNTEEMVQKGRARGAPGEEHARHKLIEEQVVEIRRAYSGAVSPRENSARSTGSAASVSTASSLEGHGGTSREGHPHCPDQCELRHDQRRGRRLRAELRRQRRRALDRDGGQASP